jgi:hypothetical protein
MASRDNYMKLARQIADYLNSFQLAFKTYNVSQLNEMMATIAGTGSRVSGDDTSNHLKTCLLERGFTMFPDITDADDGYIRVIRANSIVGSLLNAFRYVGPNGDQELARLLTQLKRLRRPDDFEPEQSE